VAILKAVFFSAAEMRGNGPVSICMVGLYHILSQLGGLKEHRKLPPAVSGADPQPQTLLGRFVRNSVRFYVCFSALRKLDVRYNNTKSTKKYNCGW